MSTYADTSFLVSLYIRDVHLPEAQTLMLAGPSVWLTPFHRAEVMHAVEQQVFRGNVTSEQARAVHSDFEQDRRDGAWVEIGFPEQAFERCAELGRRYAAELGIRTLDCLHVATALELKAERFWTFDERQAKLARTAGLKTR